MDTTARTRLFQPDLPLLRLRIAFDTGNRYNMMESAAAELRADHAQSCISGGLLFRQRQRRRDEKQERGERCPHGKIEQRFGLLSTRFQQERLSILQTFSRFRLE